MKTRHAHFSTLASSTASALLLATRTLLTRRDVITFTEVANDKRAAALRKIPGWTLVQIEGKSGADECALLYRTSKWRMIRAYSLPLSDRGVPRRNGAKVRALVVVLEDRKSGQRHLWSVAHLPSGVEHNTGYRAGVQAEIHSEALLAWAVHAAVWRNRKYAAVHLVADQNLSYRLEWVRDLMTTRFPGFTATWQPRLPKRGTHGARPIDFTLTTAKVVSARVMPKFRPFDHRPYAETLESIVSFPAPSPIYLGPAAHDSGPGNKPIHRIVLHSTVSDCEPGGARNIASYFRSENAGGSAHYVVDPGEVVQVVFDDTVAWHAPPNRNSLGVEMCDRPHPDSKARWSDENHRAMLKRTARLVAELCLAYDVPPWFVGEARLRAGARGVTTHATVSKAFGQSTHWDPGAWPRFRFMRMVRAEVKNIKAGK